jgi:hypothetical protein
MSTATKPLAFNIPEAGSSEALHTALLSAFVVAYKDEIGPIPSPTALNKLLKASNALSSLTPQVQRRFSSWVRCAYRKDAYISAAEAVRTTGNIYFATGAVADSLPLSSRVALPEFHHPVLQILFGDLRWEGPLDRV